MSWRNTTQRTNTGGVVQAGLDMRGRGQGEHHMRKLTGVYRGVVLKTFVTDSADNFRKFQVECHVLLLRSNVLLRQVPVLQKNHGVNNAHDLWTPKESTRSISGQYQLNLNLLSARGTFIAPVIPLGDLDGDQVAVEFMDGNPDDAVITAALTHEKTKRLIISGNGWDPGTHAPGGAGDGSERGSPQQFEKYTNHQGTEVRINRSGDYLIDTVGAHNDDVLEDPTTGAGQVRVRVKNTERLTIEMDGEDVLEVFKDGAQVRIDLGEGAGERIVLGDSFMSLFNLHKHPTGVGPSGVTTDQMVAGSHLSDLAKTRQS